MRSTKPQLQQVAHSIHDDHHKSTFNAATNDEPHGPEVWAYGCKTKPQFAQSWAVLTTPSNTWIDIESAKNLVEGNWLGYKSQ